MTGTGIGLAAGAAACYATGVLLGYPVLLGLAVGALFMLVAGLCAVSVRPAVVLTRQLTPDRVTVGETALGRLDVRNTSRWPAPGFVAIDAIGADTIPLAVGGLAGGGRRAIHYPVPARQRGRLRLGPLTVERRDPLGLFAWRQRQAADAVLWVHPRVHRLRPLPVGLVLDYEGRTTENARLGTVTFSSLREYVPGDDPRHIHWKSTARTGTLIVREHIDTTEPTTNVVLDTNSAALDAGMFEEAVEFAASVVRAVELIGRPVALRIVGERQADADGSLDRLALASLTPSADHLLLIETVDRVPAGGALVVVTGAVQPGVLARLAEQRRRFTPVVVATFDPAAARAGTRRRPGMSVLTGRSAVEGAAAWHRMLSGDPG